MLCIAIGYPIAYWISRFGGRRKILLLILVMLPFWTSYLIRTYAWMIILRDNGVLNAPPGGRADRRAADPAQHRLLGDPGHDLRIPAVRDPAAVRVDRSARRHLVHAARDLYASGRGAFLHVTLPLTMPGIIAASLLTFIPAIGDYVTPDLLGGAADHDRREARPGPCSPSGRDWPYGSALGFLLMVVTLGGHAARAAQPAAGDRLG